MAVYHAKEAEPPLVMARIHGCTNSWMNLVVPGKIITDESRPSSIQSTNW